MVEIDLIIFYLRLLDDRLCNNRMYHTYVWPNLYVRSFVACVYFNLKYNKIKWNFKKKEYGYILILRT